jgi:hypothetical protein
MHVKLIADLVSAAATLVIAITGVWALIYASKQLKQAHEAEKVKHLVEFVAEFDREPMVRWRKTVAEQRLRGVEFPDETLRLFDFFETIGLLVRRGYLDADDVWCSFSYWMFNVYADFRDDIEQNRRDDEHYYGDFCALVEQLRAIEHDRECSDDCPSKDEIHEFWKDEAKSVSGTPIKKRKTRKAKQKPADTTK